MLQLRSVPMISPSRMQSYLAVCMLLKPPQPPPLLVLVLLLLVGMLVVEDGRVRYLM